MRTCGVPREELFVVSKVAAEHKTYEQVDFEISAEDMEVLKNFKKIESYGESSGFPVYGGKM